MTTAILHKVDAKLRSRLNDIWTYHQAFVTSGDSMDDTGRLVDFTSLKDVLEQ